MKFNRHAVAQKDRKVFPSLKKTVLLSAVVLALVTGFVVSSGTTAPAQAANPDPLTLSMSEYVVPYLGASDVLKIQATGAWTVTMPAWVQVIDPSGTGIGMVLVVVEENHTGLPRSGSIVVTAASGSSASVAVSQVSWECGTSRLGACTWPDADKPVGGVIDTAGDADWYRFVAPASGPWTFTSTTKGIDSPIGTVYDPSGMHELATNTGGASGGQFRVTAAMVEGSQYFVEIKGSVASQTGTYTLSALRVAPTLSVSPSVATIGYGGFDQMIDVKSNAMWTLTIPPDVKWMSSTKSSGTGDQPGIRMPVNANLTGMARSAVLTFATAGGTPQVIRTLTINQVSLECEASTNLPCEWSKMDNPMSGVIDTSGDKDWYRFRVPESGTWTFTSSKPAANAVGDPYGTIYDFLGQNVVASDDNSAGNGQFRMTAELTANVPYYLEVRAANGKSTGGYTVSARQISTAKPTQSPTVTATKTAPTPTSATTKTTAPATTATKTTAAPTVTKTTQSPTSTDTCGASLTSYCSWPRLADPLNSAIDTPGDKDWYRFVAPYAGPWVITSSASASNGLADPYGTLYSANGVPVALDDNSAGNGQFKVSALLRANQVYYLEVKAASASATGGYKVTIAREIVRLLVSQPSWVPPAGGGSVAVTVRSNTLWTLSAPDWMSVSSSEGYGDKLVTLTVQPNYTGTVLEGVVTFKSTSGVPETSRSISVVQPRASQPCGTSASTPCVWSDLSKPMTGSLPAAGAQSWTRIVAPASGPWQFQSAMAGSLMTPTGTMYQRDGTTVMATNYGGGPSSQFLITPVLTAGQTYLLCVTTVPTQKGNFTVTATQMSPTLTVSPSSWVAPSEGGGVQIVILTNTTWTTSKPADMSWLSISVSAGSGTQWTRFTAQANTTGKTRSGTVTFMTTTGSPQVVRTVYVTQAPSFSALMSMDTWSVSAQGETQTISVASDGPWTVAYAPAWVSVAPDAATDDLTVTVGANTTGKPRAGVVMITAENGDPGGASLIHFSQSA